MFVCDTLTKPFSRQTYLHATKSKSLYIFWVKFLSIALGFLSTELCHWLLSNRDLARGMDLEDLRRNGASLSLYTLFFSVFINQFWYISFLCLSDDRCSDQWGHVSCHSFLSLHHGGKWANVRENLRRWSLTAFSTFTCWLQCSPTEQD